MNKLHPGAKWVFRLRAYPTLFFIGLFISIWSIQLFSNLVGLSLVIGLIALFLFFILSVLIVVEVYARMSYNRYLYELSSIEVKIERGIIWKKYTSIPYERVQNVEIRRGILARIFGFSTVDIETAGHSGFGMVRFGRGNRQRYESEGHLLAIDTLGAEKIRAFIMKKVRQSH